MRGWLPRANPLALLVVGVASVPASLAVRSLTVALVTVGLYAVVAFALVPSWRYVLLCLGFALFAGLTVAYSTWRLGGRDEVVAATAGLRIVVLAWPGSLVAVLMDPARLGDHLGQNLRMAPRPVVAVTASLQQVSELLGTWRDLGRTRRARGVAPDRGLAPRVRHGASMAFALLVASLRSASRRSVALDARGFAVADRTRTWAEPAPWTRLDVAVVAGGLALAAVPVVMWAAG